MASLGKRRERSASSSDETAGRRPPPPNQLALKTMNRPILPNLAALLRNNDTTPAMNATQSDPPLEQPLTFDFTASLPFPSSLFPLSTANPPSENLPTPPSTFPPPSGNPSIAPNAHPPLSGNSPATSNALPPPAGNLPNTSNNPQAPSLTGNNDREDNEQRPSAVSTPSSEPL